MMAAPPSSEPPIVEPPKDAGRHLWWIIPLCALLAIAGAAFVAWHGKIDRTSGETGGRANVPHRSLNRAKAELVAKSALSLQVPVFVRATLVWAVTPPPRVLL